MYKETSKEQVPSTEIPPPAKVPAPKVATESRKTPSEDKPSPEESSEVSGMQSPIKMTRGKHSQRTGSLESTSAKSSSESSKYLSRSDQPDWISSSAEVSPLKFHQ